MPSYFDASSDTFSNSCSILAVGCHDAIMAVVNLYTMPSLLMLRRAPLSPPSAHRGDIRPEPLLLGTIRPGSQFDQRMQRDLHPGALLLWHVHVIRIYAPEHGLMRHDNNVFASFQFHDDGLQTYNDVAIALATAITVIILVIITRLKVLRILVSDFLVSETVADTRIKLVQSLPFEFVVAL